MSTRSDKESSIWFPILVYLSARILISALGLILMRAGIIPTTADPVLRPYFGVTPVVEGASGALLGVWQRFDTIHYLRIAAAGYSATDLSVFYPLFPMLIRLVAIPFFHNYLLSAFLVSTLAGIGATIVFYRLVVYETKDFETARRAAVYLVFFPSAFFLFALYSESLTLLLLIAAFYCGRRQKWWAAAILGFGCALTRPTGALITVAFIAEAVPLLRAKRLPSFDHLAAIVSPVLAVAAFIAWRANAGFPPLSVVQFDYWGRMTTFPFGIIPETLQRMAAGQAMLIEYIDLAVVLLMLVVGVLVIKRLPLPYALLYWAVVGLNLSLTRLGQPISSQARFALLLFPAFIILGQLGSSPIAHRIIFVLSVTLWLFLGGQFLMWGWVG